MWRCPNCGQQIDDDFDTCWKCGSAQNGARAADFRAESDDPTAADERPAENGKEPEADHLLHERLVEVCSAGSIVEADGLCQLLEEAGIHARVVGEGPGVAAGGLALGEDVSPRIWVYESDLARAQEVIEQWRSPHPREPVELPESEITAGSEMPAEGETPVEAEYAELPSDARLRFLSQGFFIAGALCVLIGALWAWRNSTALSVYSGTATGQLAHVRLGEVKLVAPSRSRDVPPGNLGAAPSFRETYIAEYSFGVNRKAYTATLKVDDRHGAPQQVMIRYDPQQPASNIVGSVAPPWMVLLFALLVGGFLCFVGYEFG